MVDKPESRFNLNPTRIFLIAMLVVALALSVAGIVASLHGWEKQDAEAAADQPPSP
jgi:hypothetical protein